VRQDEAYRRKTSWLKISRQCLHGSEEDHQALLFHEETTARRCHPPVGKVKIDKDAGRETLAMLEKGEFFGEMAILNDKPRSATAEVVENGDMLVIDRKTFESLLRGNVEIAIRFIKRLAERLREADEQMESLMIKDSTSRLVTVLARKVKEQKSGGEIAMNVDELAGMAGMEKGQARTILEKLANVKIVELQGETLKILNQDQVDRLLRYLEMREIFGELM
jgi:CRP-like cAMP-binding protein